MKASIIIPTVGRETLPRVLEALQRCEGFEEINPEVIVVFDGNQVSDLASWRESEWLKILETGEKVYAAGARNLGLDRATGDIIIFLQDDTYPEPDWLRKHVEFHLSNPEVEKVLLGKVDWTPELANDPFHQWLLDHAQFNFKKLKNLKTKKAKKIWRYFYTSNVSLKRELIGEERFSTAFRGWGFEDTEFGYRISTQGDRGVSTQEKMILFYAPGCRVLHDHPQTLEKVLENTRNARKNALVFEHLHPGVRILPRGLKLIILKTILFSIFLIPYSLRPKSLSWWYSWKKSWIDKIW